jgi:HD-like signal output (HDOD) protein
MLGLDTLRALVLSTHVFNKFRTDILGQPEVAYLWAHSFGVASFAKHIAAFEKADRQMVDDCFTAGLLHDSGKLVLSSIMAHKYQNVFKIVKQDGRALLDAEMEVLGCNHAEVAAYLLGLWGLPEAVIEGVARHHDPAGSVQTGFSTAIATHAATFFHEQQAPFWMMDGTTLNLEYLEKSGFAGREEAWRKIAQELGGVSDPAENGSEKPV